MGNKGYESLMEVFGPLWLIPVLGDFGYEGLCSSQAIKRATHRFCGIMFHDLVYMPPGTLEPIEDICLIRFDFIGAKRVCQVCHLLSQFLWCVLGLWHMPEILAER
jgi:hypothetical protein